MAFLRTSGPLAGAPVLLVLALSLGAAAHAWSPPFRTPAQRPDDLPEPEQAPAEAQPAAPGPASPAPAAPPPPSPAQPSPPPPPPPQQATQAPLPPPPVPPPQEREATVYLKDGLQVTGLLVSEQEGSLVLRIAGISTRFDASRIDRYQVLPPIAQTYRQIRDSIEDDDVQGLLRLVDWLRAREQYDLALKEVTQILEHDAGNVEALRLKALLTSQIELRKKSGNAARPATVTRAKPDAAPTPPPGSKAVFPLLTDEQVNLIKVYEVDLDSPPRMVIHRDTVTRLLQVGAGTAHVPATQEGRDAIYRESPGQILELMFRLKARDLYREVQVLDQPASMQVFRDEVSAAWMINSCATNACHGGQEAGRLRLYNRRPRADATVYTNFLILDRFKLDNGADLINYEAPERSPLLHMGLPREDSLFPHPVVRRPGSGTDAWKRVFHGVDDRQYTRAVEWIRLMYRPRPTYPIEYQPPGASHPARPVEGEGGQPR